MKKFFALLLALLLVLSLAACGQEAPSADESKETVEETKETTEKTETSEEATEETTGTQDGDTAASGNETAAASEEIDMTGFTLGVSEDGDNVLVTVKNETDVGTVTCVMTFWYENGKLTKETADYYVPDADTASVLADELKKDTTIESGSVQIKNNCVSCQMKASELTELQALTHDELAQAMEYAIGSIQ